MKAVVVRMSQGHQARRRLGHPLRPQRRGADQSADGAGRHPHLRAGAARTARQEPHEDHLARAGGAVMAAKIKKGDKVIVLTGRDKGRTGEVIEVRPDDGRALVRGINMVKRHQKQTAQPGGRDHLQGGVRSTSPTWRSPIRRTASRPAWASSSWAKGATARKCASPSARESRSMADTERRQGPEGRRRPTRPRSPSKADKASRRRRPTRRRRATRRAEGRGRRREAEGRSGRSRTRDAAPAHPFRRGRAQEAGRAVRLQEPHAGAGDQEDRHQHGHRRGRQRPQEGRERGRRSRADRRPEGGRSPRRASRSRPSRCATARRSAAR